MSVGHEHIDLQRLRQLKRSTAVVPGATCAAAALAEMAMMFLLMLSRCCKVSESNFHQRHFLQPAGFTLEGRRFGLVGLGANAHKLV